MDDEDADWKEYRQVEAAAVPVPCRRSRFRIVG